MLVLVVMWDTSSPAEARILHYCFPTLETADAIPVGGACITGFPAVKEGELLLQHSLEHQLLDGAVYAGGCDVVHEVTH